MTSCTSRALPYLFQVVVCNKRVLLFDEHSDWLHICFRDSAVKAQPEEIGNGS